MNKDQAFTRDELVGMAALIMREAENACEETKQKPEVPIVFLVLGRSEEEGRTHMMKLDIIGKLTEEAITRLRGLIGRHNPHALIILQFGYSVQSDSEEDHTAAHGWAAMQADGLRGYPGACLSLATAVEAPGVQEAIRSQLDEDFKVTDRLRYLNGSMTSDLIGRDLGGFYQFA